MLRRAAPEILLIRFDNEKPQVGTRLFSSTESESVEEKSKYTPVSYQSF